MTEPTSTSAAETEAQDLSVIVVYFTAGARLARHVGVPGRLGYVSDPDPKVYCAEDHNFRVVAGTGFVHERLLRMPFALGWLERQIRKYCLDGASRHV